MKDKRVMSSTTTSVQMSQNFILIKRLKPTNSKGSIILAVKSVDWNSAPFSETRLSPAHVKNYSTTPDKVLLSCLWQKHKKTRYIQSDPSWQILLDAKICLCELILLLLESIFLSAPIKSCDSEHSIVINYMLPEKILHIICFYTCCLINWSSSSVE